MRINITAAQKWNELNDWQVKVIGRFMFTNRNQQTQTKLFVAFLVIVLIVGRPTVKNIVKAILVFSRAPLSDLKYLADFVFDENVLMTRFTKVVTSGRWPFRKKVYGPGPRLSNLTIEELSYADTYFYKWKTENQIIDLHRLMAILYRPIGNKKSPVDIREEFSHFSLEKNARLSENVPDHVKYMVAHAYDGCRQHLIGTYKNVFPVPRKKQDDDKKEKTQKLKPYHPFSKIIDSFAMDEVQIFGSHQKVEKVLVPKFLTVYDESIVRLRKRQEELDKRK